VKNLCTWWLLTRRDSVLCLHTTITIISCVFTCTAHVHSGDRTMFQNTEYETPYTHLLFPSADVVYPHRFCVPRVKRHCAASYIKPLLHSVTHEHMFSNLQSIWSTFLHIFQITKLPYLPKWILKKRKISIYARFATLICEKKEFSCHDFAATISLSKSGCEL
jgi:hypothetical protein